MVFIMNSLLPSMFLVIALLTFAFCGVGMMCAEQITHYYTLAGSVPIQLFIVSALLVALTISILPTDTSASAHAFFIQASRPAPDISAWPPLALAFSDGILNTKVF